MKKFLALAALALLAACSSEPAPDPIRLDYSNLGKIYLDTQDLRTVNRAQSTPQWPPYVGYQFKPSLVDAVNRLANDRLQATGQIGHATFIIKDASVTEQPLSKSDDFESWFTRQQASKYIGRIEVSLEAQAPSDGSVGMATAYATHAVTLPEKPTESEKYEAYRKLLTAMMSELNANLEKSIREHMSRFLLSGPGAPSQFAPVEERISPTNNSAMPRLMDQ